MWQVEEGWISDLKPRENTPVVLHLTKCTLVHRTLGEQGLLDMTLAPLGLPKLRVGSLVLVAHFKSLRREAL